MWNDVVDKLRRLRDIDRRYQAFGAETHKYLLRPCLAAIKIQAVESRLGISLPQALRSFYSEVGNGIAGPHYGLTPAEKLRGYRPQEEYPGIEYFKSVAAAEGQPPDESGYFEVSDDALSGLLFIISEGCGHEVCLIATGPKVGNIVNVWADGFVVETATTLVELYTKWLDCEIEKFEPVRSLMTDGKNFREIQDEMIARFKDYDAGDRIVSIADVPKPVALFGEGNWRRYYGAMQFPWYERVLKHWQRRNA